MFEKLQDLSPVLAAPLSLSARGPMRVGFVTIVMQDDFAKFRPKSVTAYGLSCTATPVQEYLGTFLKRFCLEEGLESVYS